MSIEGSIPQLGTERRKLVILNIQNNLTKCLSVNLKSRQLLWNRIPRIGFYFCSTERNSELFSLSRDERNSESLLLFCSMIQNFEHFFLPRNDWERNSESLLLFLFHSPELRAFFVMLCYADGHQMPPLPHLFRSDSMSVIFNLGPEAKCNQPPE